MVEDVNDYVFEYIYENYIYVDSVLAADDYAKEQSGNTNSWTYKSALWEKSESFTIPLFSKASGALAELIYSAWKAAGSPDMPSSSITESRPERAVLGENHPNPFYAETTFGFTLPAHAEVHLYVTDMQGNLLATVCDQSFSAGTHHILWKTDGLPPGIFFLIMNTGTNKDVKKIVSAGR